MNYQEMGFLDSDNLIYIKDGSSRITFASVQGMIDAYSQKF